MADVKITDLSAGTSSGGTDLYVFVDNSGTPTTKKITKSNLLKTFFPGADATTALQWFKADGTTVVFNMDTTNSRIGIGTAAPTATLHVLGTGLFLPVADSVTAFQIQNAGGGSTIFNVDTSNLRVGINTAAPKSSLDVQGSQTVKRTAVADAPYTVLLTDYIVAYSTLTAARAITLPLAATAAAGKVYIIKDEVGNANTFNLTITRAGADLIDGATTKVINTAYGVVRLYSNGSNWFTW